MPTTGGAGDGVLPAPALPPAPADGVPFAPGGATKKGAGNFEGEEDTGGTTDTVVVGRVY